MSGRRLFTEESNSSSRTTKDLEHEENQLRTALAGAEAVIIGAGSGLSAAAGFDYSGERFQQYFWDFIKIYQFQDMYSGGFYPFDSLEEHWAYWSRYIYINRYLDPPGPVYKELYELLKEKDYFVLTTNVDHCFQKAGFDKERLFYTQGDYGLFQCSEPCHQKTYDNEELIRRMVRRQKNRRIPTELIPHCPHCGRPMTMNLRMDDRFVQDEGWYLAKERCETFFREHKDHKILLLDLGTGMNTPGIIKFPFWRMAMEWPHAVYACVNLNETWMPQTIREKSICVQADIGAVIKRLLPDDSSGTLHLGNGKGERQNDTSRA